MDDFSDDDFDTLNANILQELENNAIQFTQAQKKYQQSQTQPQLVDDFEDDDLDDAVVQDELRGNSILPEETTQLPSRPINSTPRNPLPAPTTSRQPQQPFLAPQLHHIAKFVHRLLYPDRLLLFLRDTKPRKLKGLMLTTKDGEIGIVRKRLEKTREDHERELQALKKQATEQVSKHERALEAAKAAQQAASTELEFTRRDLKDELDRARRKDGPATPKKNAAAKSWGIADGFEDVEMAGSPSKGRRGRNTGAVAGAMVEPPARLTRTPTKGKRKRLAADSPIAALETHSEDAIMLDHAGVNDTSNAQFTHVDALPRAASFDVVAGALIERISHQLVEKPRWEIDQYKQRGVRNAVLRTLAAFARSPFGLAQLAINDYAIPRLVTLLSSCIDELYDGDMRYESSEDDVSQKELQKLVARSVLLLHTIITNPLTADLVNVSGKLAKPPGVSQKYLLSLGRLNFSEDLVSEETAELAHELLELAVTPEEGEELGRFFGG
ncbi:putative dna repair protein rad26 protein [Daldinia childiae]|uniref:putative dna repair protein rad26 protein n=1 Tax=Daldinia childiae TaxID=326645 RepID=UPI0014461959|nr:putative dna repair protein rad26 protein [Daldinia childiae]KAF3065900.1 putative dna repair protein rad26 protein [Daldinia childiae]